MAYSEATLKSYVVKAASFLFNERQISTYTDRTLGFILKHFS
jgi:hypothetical protein